MQAKTIYPVGEYTSIKMKTANGTMNGYYEFTNIAAPNDITIAEVMQQGWTQTLPGGSGTYQLSVVPNGQYTNKNFGNTSTPLPTDVTISGVVTGSDGTPIAGVTMYSVNGSTTTSPNGYYQLTIPYNPWTGSVIPGKDCYTFSPASRPYSSLLSDINNQNFIATSTCPYSGGDGSEQSPYLIATPQDLNEIDLHMDHRDKCFKLIADIDMSAYSYQKAVMRTFSGGGFFKGTFDGNGHVIKNLTINAQGNDQYWVGLFGRIENPAMIKNLKLENVVITSIGDSVSGLCGYNDQGTISNCSVSVTVSCEGLDIGGLCGYNNGGIIVDCYAVSNIQTSNSSQNIGGLCGINAGGQISSSYAISNILGGDECRGIGSLCGRNTSSGLIENCYAEGEVKGNINVAGLCGLNFSETITKCYSTSKVSSTGGYPTHIGGFCGWNNDTISNSFWDTETSNSTQSDGGTGLITNDMFKLSTYKDSGWDLTAETANGTDDIWRVCDGFDYPHLSWEEMVPGDIACPDGVGIEDFAALAAQWSLPHLDGDVWPNGGDGAVSPETAYDARCDIPLALSDGQINSTDLAVIADQWLQKSIYSADIAPTGGDNAVDSLDLNVIAENWLKGR